ncbi:MAG: PEP-CTERM sorting domain-containing protein [Phycisphaerae bacterium]|nr:MAG: PEP-CTERM sorting domain-containing protein [Planctomycetota bacterium]KAB2946861.1 MAG: PEP-CTERM sorting domain-containing protein [Phycisphaerae bacterium]MBE7457045.1 PEP-CTERM sorting domain-containing protein [Planctomycetia bacterium]MCK6463597.1 PEP-CTERM sorting domain-containing protein [Phycisphaerae bacterium]MCL4718265.1 PEP-CTERM sorting domain-containing protein [Phycisphaerae bacterium]
MIRKAIFGLAMLAMSSAVYAGDIILDMRVDGFDNNALFAGQNYDAVISLAAPQGTSISSVRLMQMDQEFSSGISNIGYAWNITGIDDSLYFKEIYSDIPTVVRANYIGFDPIPGFILDLTDTPTEIGRYSFTFNSPGELNLVGQPNDDGNRDHGLYFQTGFNNDLETYFIGKGNILPGGQSTSGGVLPLTPEPASLALLGLGAFALLRRRNR